jgi:TRAP-type C4-dicarboxylate transport system permease small subunit
MNSLKAGKYPEALGRILMIIGGIAMVMMMLHIVTDVVLKHTLNDPIDGTTEIVAAYYMVALVYLPLAYVTFSEGHLIVELFTSKMSGRPLRLLTAISGVVTVFYLFFLIFVTVDEAVLRTLDGEAWETSVDLVAVWPSRWLLPIGLTAMGLIVIAQVIRWRRGDGEDYRQAPPGV